MKQPTPAMFTFVLLTVAICCQLAANNGVEAGQGCPFDDGSCQEYCSQQGCNMGYCGHFAWIQCICRKCGDEWSWYDKVHYNPDKTVNQTELDSLKLNATSPLILTNSSTGQQQPTPNVTSSSARGQPGAEAGNKPEQQQQQQRATLTTLLIPDLSDSSKLDLNDIPDENSDKFLDYLAKNHERLVQATSSRELGKKQQQQQQQPAGEDQLTAEETGAESTSAPSGDDETVEIQISSNDNSSSSSQQTTQESTSSASSSQPAASSTASPAEPSEAAPSSTTSQPQAAQPKSPLIRLLHMASDEQLFETSEQ